MNAHDPQLAILAARYAELREQLMAVHGLAEDDPALLDTLDGISDLPDRLAALIDRALELERHCKAIAEHEGQLRERRRHKEAQAEKLREIVLHHMDAVGLPKIERPEFCASVAWTAPKLVGADKLDPETLHERFVRIKIEIDKPAIRKALEAGEAVEGAALSNPSRCLRIR